MSSGETLININIGILGHVDSGKTTLARALSNVSSTAAFDKHPQSRERGITLDLGFSAFSIPTPAHLKHVTETDHIQFTIVDCPGHASLIRTIIGGAQIIDMMILVVDVQKGIQTQTAECLVIGEITCKNIIVVLNKIDTIVSSTKDSESILNKLETRLRKVLSSMNFNTNKIPIFHVSALSGTNLNSLVEFLEKNVEIPNRTIELGEKFLFSVDHCFNIKGQGTICTGTVLQGKVQIGDTVEIPLAKETRKIKSMQMFRKPVDRAKKGDRVGICITQFNANLMERGILSDPGYITLVYATIIPIEKIKYFKNSVKSYSKYHITIGHETVMGQVILFRLKKEMKEENPHEKSKSNGRERVFDPTKEYEYIEEISSESCPENQSMFSLLEFETPVLASSNCLLIGSKLDTDINSNSCRLAFWGRTNWLATNKSYLTDYLANLKIVKYKLKQGKIQRIINDQEIIVQDLFKKDAKKDLYISRKITLTTGEEGVIDSLFGQTTKLRVKFNKPLKEETLNQFKLGKSSNEIRVTLKYKKYLFNKNCSFIQ